MACSIEPERRMHVLFLIRSLDRGGAERQLVVLARELHQRGHRVSVAVCYSGGALEGDLKDASVRIIPLDKRGRWDVAGFLVRLIRTVRSERPDLLYAYIMDLMTVFVQPFLRSMKIVWSIRSSNMDYSRYDWLCGTSYALSCWFSKSADLIISNSYAGRQVRVADGYPSERTVVIPNGIDTKRFYPNGEARDRIRIQWGVREDEFLIGLVGRLDPMKDHETFFQAAVLLLQKSNQVRFVCVGDGPAEYSAALQDRAKRLGLSDRMMWVGGQSEMPHIYNALDLLVNSSSYGEGFANVLGEGMACGVPCVATDVGDSGLVIGDSGQLVPPKDPAALKTAMFRVLSRKPAAAEIRRRIVEHFSVENLVLTTEQTLLTLCHQPTSRSVTSQEHTPVC
ncbi:MAG: glycosyltransferase [Nitrospira sp.]|nr:glycosyltransferase [Nitrospira sp.]